MSDHPSLLPRLTVASGPMQGATFSLRTDTCVIGRDEGADVLVDDIQVSRRHAVIERRGEIFTLADAGSTNGTWLNDVRVEGAAELDDGDRIRVGGVELRFFDLSSATTERVGTRFAMTSPAASSGRRPAGALSAPTLAMPTGRRSKRPWLFLTASIVVVAAVVVWAFLRG